MNQTRITTPEDKQIIATGDIVFAAGLAEIGSTIYLTQTALEHQNDGSEFIYVTPANGVPEQMAGWQWPNILPTQLPGDYNFYITTFINNVLISQSRLYYTVSD